MLFIIYNYFTTIGDLCDSGSAHIYGFPGLAPTSNNAIFNLLTLYISEI